MAEFHDFGDDPNVPAEPMTEEELDMSLAANPVKPKDKNILLEFFSKMFQNNDEADSPLVIEYIEGKYGDFPDEDKQDIDRVTDQLIKITEIFKRDTVLHEHVKELTLEKSSIMEVFRNVMQGTFNWGKLIAQLYFAYLIMRKAAKSLTLFRNVLNWCLEALFKYFLPWIVNHGGWTAFTGGLNISNYQFFAIQGLFILAFMFLSKKFSGSLL